MPRYIGGLHRLLRLMKQLEGLRYAPPLAQLAAEHHTTKRTIRRDLELLEEVGIVLPRWRHREIA